MQLQPWKKIGAIALLASALLLVSWWIGQRPYITAGSHKVFRMDSNAGAMVGFFGFIMLLSATPRTIVSIGDGYCWDLWCLGVEQVNATPQGQNIIYTARVRLFSDANHVPDSREKDFLYVIDDQGRRFPVFQDSAALPSLNVTVHPNESVTTSLSFLAPANARKLI